MQKRVPALLLAFLLLSVFILTIHTLPPIRAVAGLFENSGIGPKAILFSWSKQGSSQNSEVEKLKKENQDLTQKFVNYENLKKDNDALRSQFQDTTVSPSQLLPADIIGFEGIDSHPSIIFINSGKDNKLDQGMVVIFQNNLIGKIQNVSDHISSVITIYNKNFNALGQSLQDKTPGVVHGEEDFVLLDQVVITDTLKSGDLVVFIGDKENHENIINLNIIVGKISSIAKSETAPFQSAKIDSLVDYSKLSKVFILER